MCIYVLSDFSFYATCASVGDKLGRVTQKADIYQYVVLETLFTWHFKNTKMKPKTKGWGLNEKTHTQKENV